MRTATDIQLWLAAGVRTPFARSDGPLAEFDAIQLSVIVVKNMMGQLRGALPALPRDTLNKPLALRRGHALGRRPLARKRELLQ